MEVSATTFKWMRDVGCMTTQHVTTSRVKGMLTLTNAGVHTLLAGKTIVKLLQHYCCYRFDTPAALQPEEGDTPADKRHNWAIVGKILKDALLFDLSWERRELIVQGDIVEVIVLLKQIQDLVAKHRRADQEERLRHRLLAESPVKVDVVSRLCKPFMIGESKPLAPHSRPWLEGASKKPPSKLPPLEQQRAPRRMKPRLPPEAKTPAPIDPMTSPWHSGGGQQQTQQQRRPAHSAAPQRRAGDEDEYYNFGDGTSKRQQQQQQQQQRAAIEITANDL
jgi:hypothetical protein